MSRKHIMPAAFSKLLRILVFIAKVKKLSLEKYYASLMKKTKQRNRKKLRLMEHYHEFEFSPSSSPLIRYSRKQFKKNRASREFEALFFFVCKCWGSFGAPEGCEEYGDFTVEALPASEDVTEHNYTLALIEPSTVDWESDEASIDMRAQRFIERFYEDMRMQRKESTSRASLMNIA